jgi:hypothetical protein
MLREFGYFFASLAAVLCELCGYNLFLFAVGPFKKPLTAKIAKVREDRKERRLL